MTRDPITTVGAAIVLAYALLTIAVGGSAWLVTHERVWQRVCSGEALRDVQQAMEGR